MAFIHGDKIVHGQYTDIIRQQQIESNPNKYYGSFIRIYLTYRMYTYLLSEDAACIFPSIEKLAAVNVN